VLPVAACSGKYYLGRHGSSLLPTFSPAHHLLQEQVLCDHGAPTTGSNQLSQSGEQVEKQVNTVFHACRGEYPSAKAAIAKRLTLLMK
jgi:hypothetical protein